MRRLQRGDLRRRLALRALLRLVERRVHDRQVGEQQIAANGRELLGRLRVGAERPDHQGQRLDLSQLRDALRRGHPARHVDEPHLRGHGLLGALHLGEDGEPGIGDGHDRDVGLTAVRARAGQRREEGRLPGERHADQPDVLHERRAYQPVAARRTGETDRTASPAGGADIGRSARKLRPFGQCCNGRRVADVTYETRRWRGAARPTPPRRVLLSVWLVWLITVWSSCGRAGIRRPRPSAVSCTVGNRTRPGRKRPGLGWFSAGSAYDFVAQKIFAISSTAFSSS